MSRKPPQFTPEELETLRKVVYSPPVFLTAEKQRDLRILLGLCEGKQGKVLAMQEAVSATWVTRLRNEMKSGLKAALDRILSVPKKKEARELPTKRTRAGRPGYETFADWARAMRPEDESICELVSLYITPATRIAIVGFREGRDDDYWRDKAEAGKKNRLDAFVERRKNRVKLFASEIWRASTIPVHWTRVSILDTMLAETFDRLAVDLSDITNDQELPTPPLSSRFGERFRFVVLFDGQKEACCGLLRKIAGDDDMESVRADPKIGFSRHLEAFFHGRRLKASCAGLLPTAWRWRDKIREWFIEGCGRPLVWNVDEATIRGSVQYHSLVGHYFGAKGVLIEMQSYLWTRIAHGEEIRIRSIPRSTRVEKADTPTPAAGVLRVRIEPLANIAYHTSLPSQGDVNAMLKGLRERIKKNKQSKQFVYSTRQRESIGVRPSIQLSADFMEGTTNTAGIGVVLLPRHFVTAEPEHPLEELAAFAAELGNADDSNAVMIDRENYTFSVPLVVGEIQRRLADGTYERKLEELEEWQSTLTDLGATALGSGENDTLALSLKLRAEAVLGRDLWDIKTEKGWHESPLGMLFAFAKEFPIQPDGSIQPIAQRVRTPDLDFRNLVTNLDADFLLLSFGATIRRTLDQLVENWNAAVGNLIVSKYWPNGALNLPFVRELVPDVSGSRFYDLQTEVETLCDEARRRFESDPKYVLRAAMENMQRLALGGFPSSPVVVETERRILARWQALLRRILRGRLTIDSGAEIRSENATDTAELLYRADEAEVIVTLIKNIRTSNSEAQLKQLVQFAQEIEKASWWEVIEKLACIEPEVGWFNIVEGALKICNEADPAHLERPTLDALARLLCS